ncbi:hypothetical protein AB0M28_29430 [Streptomyces sp. NPDC051940]|uniref:hypothetical protein n=1 Tax=Streptomyces sp. NPDC051940 TaxID=3155675 RepID=UPI00343DB4A3
MRVRRVVTGHDSTGRAVVVSDTELQPQNPEVAPKWSVWATEQPPSFPDEGKEPAPTGPVPPPGGFEAILLTLPPGFTLDGVFDPADPATAQITRALGFLPDPNPPSAYPLPGSGGMHATPSVDVLLQVSGTSVLVLPSGEVSLSPGDWLVLNGVTHAWRNDGAEPAVLAGFTAGARHQGIPELPPG